MASNQPPTAREMQAESDAAEPDARTFEQRLWDACRYLNEDRALHAASGKWMIDPGKLVAALESGGLLATRTEHQDALKELVHACMDVEDRGASDVGYWVSGNLGEQTFQDACDAVAEVHRRK